jgi:transposase
MKRLTKTEKREIKRLVGEGKKLQEVANMYGVSEATISYHTAKTRGKKSTTQSDTTDYKTLYYKALAILVENRLIEVELT